jgi:GTPase Era involved in 16S rRNA processing
MICQFQKYHNGTEILILCDTSKDKKIMAEFKNHFDEVTIIYKTDKIFYLYNRYTNDGCEDKHYFENEFSNISLLSSAELNDFIQEFFTGKQEGHVVYDPDTVNNINDILKGMELYN